MLLILAGVALASLTGQGNRIGNAENAVGNYNNSVASEQQLLNEIEKYFIEHTNGGEIQDTNNPIVTATEGEETITEGTSIDISSYFTYSANGAAEITNVAYTDTSNGDTVVTNTSTLEVGTHVIKCTVTKETGAVASATKTIIVEAYVPVIVEAGDIAKNPEEHFGGYVTNYTTPSGDPNVKWRIFYADESNIYLISSDYILGKYAPASQNGTLSENYKEYYVSFDNVINDYKGAEDITDSRITKWLSFVSQYPNSQNNNMKAIAFILDEQIWSEKYVNLNYAEYAIGSPTIELFAASYKGVFPQKYIEYRYNSNGYQVKFSDETDEAYGNGWKGGLRDINHLYFQIAGENLWLASPHSSGKNDLMGIGWSGNIINNRYNGTSWGLRPIICLKNETKLEKISDTEYRIVE